MSTEDIFDNCDHDDYIAWCEENGLDAEDPESIELYCISP